MAIIPIRVNHPAQVSAIDPTINSPGEYVSSGTCREKWQSKNQRQAAAWTFAKQSSRCEQFAHHIGRY